jgi:hypothetical protein
MLRLKGFAGMIQAAGREPEQRFSNYLSSKSLGA